MGHMAVMDGINLVFLFGGCCYWWPIVGLDPIVHWRMGYGAKLATLALGVPFEAFLGIAIMSEHSPIASMYSLSGTHAGGALFWATTELSTFIGLVPVFWQWMRADERAGARADARSVRAERLDLATAAIPEPYGALEAANAARPVLSTSPLAQQFKPLLQPGNSSWEAMWRAKAGFVPSPTRAPAGEAAAPSS
jgi:hypothetical protein